MCMRPTGGIYVILITFIVCDVWSMMWLCVLVCRDIHVQVATVDDYSEDGLIPPKGI